MDNILSIIGIIVSVVAIFISLWLFNKSLDNSRKVLLNKILYFITYDSQILTLISHSTKNGNVIGAKVTESDVKTYNKSLFALDRMLNDIKFNNKIGIPLIGEHCFPNDNGKYTHQYIIEQCYDRLKLYLQKRKLPNLNFLMEDYDGWTDIINHYNQVIKYTRFLWFGSINGIKIFYKRRRKYAQYGSKKIKLIKAIKNDRDYLKYYKSCYTKFEFIDEVPKKPLKCELNNIEVIVEQPTVTIYR